MTASLILPATGHWHVAGRRYLRGWRCCNAARGDGPPMRVLGPFVPHHAVDPRDHLRGPVGHEGRVVPGARPRARPVRLREASVRVSGVERCSSVYQRTLDALIQYVRVESGWGRAADINFWVPARRSFNAVSRLLLPTLVAFFGNAPPGAPRSTVRAHIERASYCPIYGLPRLRY